jgi:hypothetical protein
MSVLPGSSGNIPALTIKSVPGLLEFVIRNQVTLKKIK